MWSETFELEVLAGIDKQMTIQGDGSSQGPSMTSHL